MHFELQKYVYENAQSAFDNFFSNFLQTRYSQCLGGDPILISFWSCFMDKLCTNWLFNALLLMLSLVFYITSLFASVLASSTSFLTSLFASVSVSLTAVRSCIS